MRIILWLASASLLVLGTGCNKVSVLGPGDENHLASAAETDCGYVQNSNGQRVSWKLNIPVHLQIPSSYPSQYIDVLKAAGKVWEDAAGKTLFIYETAPDYISATAQKDSANVVYWMTDWDSGQSSVQALTSVYWSRNTLIEADMKVDARFFNYYIDVPNSSADVHLQSLLIHELGHLLGLKHRTVAPTVMWASLRADTVRAELSDSDLLSLKCEY